MSRYVVRGSVTFTATVEAESPEEAEESFISEAEELDGSGYISMRVHHASADLIDEVD